VRFLKESWRKENNPARKNCSLAENENLFNTFFLESQMAKRLILLSNVEFILHYMRLKKEKTMLLTKKNPEDLRFPWKLEADEVGKRSCSHPRAKLLMESSNPSGCITLGRILRLQQNYM
jgi:hypothetical protein